MLETTGIISFVLIYECRFVLQRELLPSYQVWSEHQPAAHWITM